MSRDEPKLSVTGDISLEECKFTETVDHVVLILIIGPTGAGKSSFIEALAGEGQSLAISKDQLSGFTQEVTVYKLQNTLMTYSINGGSFPIYLIDTPGFSDGKISEMEVVSKVRRWMKAGGHYQINRVLYLCPITDTRASGSKRRTIKMFQSLIDGHAKDKVTIVTTMWDRVHHPQVKERAEANFAQLQNDIWKEIVETGSKMARFYNTPASALHIVRCAVDAESLGVPLTVSNLETSNTSPFMFLYEELLDRINNSQQEKEFFRLEAIRLITKPGPLLESVVHGKLSEVRQDLEKFLGQLAEFGDPLPGFEAVPETCAYQQLLDDVNEAREEQAALEAALASLQVGTHPDAQQEVTFNARLELVRHDLEDRITRLVEHGLPPKGLEKALEIALEPPTQKSKHSLQPWSPRSNNANTDSPSVPVSLCDIVLPRAAFQSNPTTSLSVISAASPDATPLDFPSPAPPHPDAIDSDVNAAPVKVTTAPICSAATPEGSMSSRISPKDRFRRGFNSLKTKFTFGTKSQPTC